MARQRMLKISKEAIEKAEIIRIVPWPNNGKDEWCIICITPPGYVWRVWGKDEMMVYNTPSDAIKVVKRYNKNAEIQMGER